MRIFLILIISVSVSLAQDECPDAEALLAACVDTADGEICYADGSVHMLSDVDTIATDDGSAALIRNGDTTMVLFGAVEIEDVMDSGEAVTLPLRNTVGYAVNLRAEPDVNAAVSGTFDRNEDAVAIGRDDAAAWFQIETDDGPQWVYAELVTVDGDAGSLPVMAGKYTGPLEAMRVIQGETCSGLLMQATGAYQINGVDLVMEGSTIYLNQDHLFVLGGAVDVSRQDETVSAEAGMAVSLNDDFVLEDSFEYMVLQGVPMAALPDPAICFAHFDKRTPVHAGPSEDYPVLLNVNAMQPYRVTGENNEWWQINLPGYEQTWVMQEGSVGLGACGRVALVEAPPEVQVQTDQGIGSMNYLPEGQSVWMANSGTDQLSGDCTSPPIAICNHLVAIIPQGGGQIMWRGQEPTPYMLRQVASNNYVFEGRSVLGDANVSLNLIFTSESSWTMTFARRFDDNPECTHTFYYTASRQW
jgi:SH3-like domain-containing protein